jgi:hypothetical protein
MRHHWGEDAKRVEWLAVNVGVEGFTHRPEEVIELLTIFHRYDANDREELIRVVARALYPFSKQGNKSIERFIRRAGKGAGA